MAMPVFISAFTKNGFIFLFAPLYHPAMKAVGPLRRALGCAASGPWLRGPLRSAWALIGLAGLPALAAGLAEDLTRRVEVRHRLLATMGAGVLFALATTATSVT